MNAFATSITVLAVLVLGAYALAVLERVFAHPRALMLAFAAPVIDAVRLLREEDVVPRNGDRLLFRSAPPIAVACVALAALVVPVGSDLVGFDPSIGLFYFIVVLGPVVIAMMNAGWSQNGKEGLFGAFRAAAVLLAYEVPLGFAAIGPVMHAQSLSLVRIVEAQATLWYVAWQPLGLAIFLVSALIMTYRHPFDIPQAHSELEGGVLAAYSGVRRLLFRVALDALFLLLMTVAALLFLGGWRGPLLAGPVWLALKTFALAALVLGAARFCPRLRHDQALALSWKILLPASLVNITLVGILTLIL
ncbi:MAG TPA: complex I subunit 1 family protein [Rhodanobacteraceae bacterium]|nr:complex I subunit 1 family protein [Rhodanobacteraceae bacterium]